MAPLAHAQSTFAQTVGRRIRQRYLAALLRQDVAFFDTDASTGGIMQVQSRRCFISVFISQFNFATRNAWGSVLCTAGCTACMLAICYLNLKWTMLPTDGPERGRDAGAPYHTRGVEYQYNRIYTQYNHAAQGLNEDATLVQHAMSEKVGHFLQNLTTFFAGFGVAFWASWDMALVMVSRSKSKGCCNPALLTA